MGSKRDVRHRRRRQRLRAELRAAERRIDGLIEMLANLGGELAIARRELAGRIA